MVPETPAFDLTYQTSRPGHSALCLQGRLTFADSNALWSAVRAYAARAQAGERFDFDMSSVEHVDGGAMALLVHVRSELKQRGVHSEFIGAPEPIQEIVRLYHGDMRPLAKKRRRAQGTLDQLGLATTEVLRELQLVLSFFGEMLIGSAQALRSPRGANVRELWPTMERAGADAVPIVLLINFLVGLVTAFQASIQLKKYGADVFVADMVGLSMTRELGPLMTAIVVCGRSGAAFAAELGSMAINEEIDALRTMGFSPMRFLVLPRTFGLVLVMPLLTLLADAIGIVGGLVVALFALDVGFTGYLTQTEKVVHVWDVYQGVIKSMCFALAIGLIACQQGLAASGGAESVGRRTTSAVVATLFALIVIDAIFTVLLQAFHS